MCSTFSVSRMVLLAVSLVLVASSPTGRSPDPEDVLELEDPPLFPQPPFRPIEDEASLNEMFREVEELMEDTQSKLNNAVKEMEEEEIAADKAALKDLPPNYHNESIKERKVGNDTILTRQEIDKKTDNKTGSTYVAETIVSQLKSGDKKSLPSFKCIVDEDCKPGNYCHLSSFNYKCLPCKEEEMCTRDGECCDGRLCVWGQCKQSTKGESGTICEIQHNCDLDLCCAVHTSLLYPVCTPLPLKGENCQTVNPLLDLFTWELEPEAPLDSCPCSNGLVCQPQGDNLLSVCEEPSLDAKRDHSQSIEDEQLLVTPVPQEDMVYEYGSIAPKGIGVEPSGTEDSAERQPEFAPEPHFVDYI
ncbi:dickkopf-related protein 3 [Mixophyes fleayi]|uniref:dickkopf-related protein 3 n=1 Tax=Mixophyes fleayi TaxID=3061075 RepID=UPI003F4D9647